MRYLKFMPILTVLLVAFVLFSVWVPDQGVAAPKPTTTTTTTTTSTTTTTTTSTTTTTIRNAKLIVAKSGGDFTTITDALNAISPSATSPYIIEVWPGTYIENVTMKSYVTLQGSGRDVTTIQSTGTIIDSNFVTNVTITDFTIKGGGSGRGIDIEGSTSITINANTITGNGSGIQSQSGTASVIISENTITNNYDGIQCPNSANVSIKGNTITANSRGIYCYMPNNSLTIIDNVISGNTRNGIEVNAAPLTIRGNTITGNSSVGVSASATNGLIRENTITGNGTDVAAFGPPPLHVSFNVFDTFTGTCVGKFNVKSDGTAWPDGASCP